MPGCVAGGENLRVRVQAPRETEHLVDRGMKVYRLLEQLRLNPESVLVIRDGQLLTGDDWLEPDDEVVVRSVISGG